MMMHNDSNTIEKFYFDSLPASVESIQSYTRKFYPQEKVKVNFIQKILIITFIAFLRGLPYGVAYHLGSFIGNFLYFIKIRSNIASTNLDIVYGDTKSASEKNAIYRASLINFGHLIINYIRLQFAGKDFWANHCELVNEAVLKRSVNRKKGVLLIGGHIGMWDLAGGKVGMSGYPTSVVSKKLSNPVINKLISDARTAMNMGGIEPKNTMGQIFSALKRGESIVLALDQNIKKEKGVFLDWMGKNASCVKSTAYIIKKSGAAVIPGFMVQRGPKEFQVILGDEVPWLHCPEDPEKELKMNNQNQADAVQQIILQNPELWLWIYKRWKICPDGEKDPYQREGL